MPRVRVVAVTYYDDRGVGGSEGVTVYHRRLGHGERESLEAHMQDWYALARSTPDGDCYVKYGPSLMDYPADDDPKEIFGGHDIAVHVRLIEPVYIELTATEN